MRRIATVEECYQSYNVEMAEVIGGNFWKPYTEASIAEMRAKASAPPVVRASGNIELPVAAERSTLSAQPLESEQVELNGRTLALGANDALPELRGVPVAPGLVTFAPSTITFVAVPSAGNAACR